MEDLGLDEQKKLAESHKKARGMAFAHHEMKKTHYKIKDAKKDALGNYVDPGYLDTRQAARSMNRSVKSGLKEGFTQALTGAGKGFVAGAVVGSVVPGFGTLTVGAYGAGAGAVKGFLSGFKQEVGANLDTQISDSIKAEPGKIKAIPRRLAAAPERVREIGKNIHESHM